MAVNSTLDERLRRVFCDVMKVPEDRYDEELSVGDIPEWDSIAQVTLLMSVEAEFGLNFDVIDAIDVESINDLRALVAKYESQKP